jgi:electron transport complex, rnfABCDGE type, E subunit
MNRRRTSVFDGILGENIVLSSLMVISPVIICGNTLKNAEALIYAFNSITFLSVLISSFVPRKLPYALKIIIYALISSVVYIPIKMAANEFFPESITRIGIYYPLLAVNSLIVFQSEAKLFRMKRGKMAASLFFYILGFDAVMLITGFLRELFAFGTIRGKIVDIDTLISGLSQPFGGFIFLGLMCGIYRRIRASAVRNYNEARGEADVSDK